MGEPSRIFVPSVIQVSGEALGLGMFSQEETAWQVLRTFLKKSHVMELKEASVVVWDVDVIGDQAMNLLSHIHCRQCPVCKRQTFWMDIDQYSALCYGEACEAWIEESEYEDEKINCGWPQTRFIKQNNSLEEALKELSRIGDEIEAAGHTEEDEEMERDLLYGYSFKKA